MQEIRIVCNTIGVTITKSNEDTLNIGGYRKLNAWKPKHKFFKSTEESPPPECPMHNKDYNDKQRELTDLNWDGSESKTIDRE